jgi:hypothetical protein
MSIKWSFSIEDDARLAECGSKQPCSYDVKRADYKDQQKRENVYKSIHIKYMHHNELLICCVHATSGMASIF